MYVDVRKHHQHGTESQSRTAIFRMTSVRVRASTRRQSAPSSLSLPRSGRERRADEIVGEAVTHPAH